MIVTSPVGGLSLFHPASLASVICVRPTQVGSDSAFQWTALFCIAVLSAWATLVWTLLDLRRRRYDRLQTWVWTVLRLLLAAAMFYPGWRR
jgi:hypothetical protein